MGYNSISSFIFMFKFPELSVNSLLKQPSVSFYMYPSLSEQFLTSCTARILRLILRFPCTSSGVAHFCTERWLPWWTVGEWYSETEIWALGMLTAIGRLLDRAKGCAHEYACMHAQIHLYLCPFLYVSTYRLKSMYSQKYLQF